MVNVPTPTNIAKFQVSPKESAPVVIFFKEAKAYLHLQQMKVKMSQIKQCFPTFSRAYLLLFGLISLSTYFFLAEFHFQPLGAVFLRLESEIQPITSKLKVNFSGETTVETYAKKICEKDV